MTQIDGLIAALNNTDPLYLYLSIFFFAFIENLFPPSPSDLVIAFGGSLVGVGKLDPVLTVFWATLGGTLGFAVVYFIGFFFGKEILNAGKFRFLPLDKVTKVEHWFTKYGYGLVVANRFLSGTRAVISFFAGISKLPFSITLPLCAVSALLWDSLLVFGGAMLGRNWRLLEHYLDIYGLIVVILIIAVSAFFLLRYLYKRTHD
ncbi:MAG: DedA family protein [Bacteroidetes bacterium]|nr:DedA family protein [Bacteroidota bacterium]MCL5268572.1 DedA family protein [Bacteroidota bacterium]